MSYTHHDSVESTSGDAEARQDVDKFRVLLKHWIEHNVSHEAEFEKWARRARDADLKEVSCDISAAADSLREITDHLRDAMAHLRGGTKEK
jgi:hypothetical protein